MKNRWHIELQGLNVWRVVRGRRVHYRYLSKKDARDIAAGLNADAQRRGVQDGVVARRMVADGWRRHPRRDMAVWTKDYLGLRLFVTQWFIPHRDRDGAVLCQASMHQVRVEWAEHWCVPSEGLAFSRLRREYVHDGSAGLRSLAQRAMALARRVAKKRRAAR